MKKRVPSTKLPFFLNQQSLMRPAPNFLIWGAARLFKAFIKPFSKSQAQELNPHQRLSRSHLRDVPLGQGILNWWATQS